MSRLVSFLFLVCLGHYLAPGPAGVVEAGRQCLSDERHDLELVRVEAPGRVLLETSGVKRKEDCYNACCQASTVGCNAAAFTVRGRVGVCQLLKCEPFASCVWKPGPQSFVIRVKVVKNTTSGPKGSQVILSPQEQNLKHIPKSGNDSVLAENKPRTDIQDKTPKKSEKDAVKPTENNNKSSPGIATGNSKISKNANEKLKPESLKKLNDKTIKAQEDLNKSKGFFDSLRDFLTGKTETKQGNAAENSKNGGNNKNQSAINKINENDKSKSSNGKVKSEQPKVGIKTEPKSTSNAKKPEEVKQEDKGSIKKTDSVRQTEMGKEKSVKKNQPQAKVAPPNPNSNQPKSNTEAKKPEQLNKDDFNIMPVSLNDKNSTSTKVSHDPIKENKNKGNAGVNNEKKQAVVKNTAATQMKTQASGNMDQLQQQKQHHEQLKKQLQQKLKQQQLQKKRKDEIARASVTSLMVGACTAVLLAILVIVVVCRKVLNDDVAQYKPLRNYDVLGGGGHGDQRQMLLGSGQRININSI